MHIFKMRGGSRRDSRKRKTCAGRRWPAFGIAVWLGGAALSGISGAASIPGTILTPSVWWDANATNNIISGNLVVQLTDQSGNANNGVVSGAGAPLLSSGAINGLAALYFGGSQALISATGALTGNSSHTVFVVAKYVPGVTGSSQSGAAFYSGSSSGGQNSALGVHPSNGYFWIGGYSQDAAPYTDTNGLNAANSFFILGKVYNSSGASYTGYLNGGVEISASSGSGAASYNLGKTDVGVGRQYDTGGYWGGYIAEAIFFNTALAPADVQAVEQYLNAKYNITSGPKLAIQPVSHNQIQISWLGQNSSYQLGRSTNAAGPFSYAGLVVSTAGLTNTVVDAVSVNAMFYRLQQQTNVSLIPVVSEESDPDGATLRMNPGTLKLQVFSPTIIRVAYSLSNSVPPWSNSLAVVTGPANGSWPLSVTANEDVLSTGIVEAHVNRASGAVSFSDARGTPILAEPVGGGKSLVATNVGGYPTWASQQQFAGSPGEAFYGLGQHQSGVMNYVNSSVHLQQANPGESGVPVLVSSRGYGLLWDNPAISDVTFGNSEQIIPATQLLTTNGLSGGLNGTYYAGTNFNTLLFSRVDPQINFNWGGAPPTNTMSLTNYSVEWDGFIQPAESGLYRLYATTDDGLRLWVDGVNYVNDWTSRAAKTYIVSFNWKTNGPHSIRYQYYQNTGGAIAQLGWVVPGSNGLFRWTSQAADAIDYYFMYGPELDSVVADYRYLSGNPPLFARWAWGYWQSRNRYSNETQIMGVVNWYRSNGVPLDSVVQDYHYWDPNPWGSDQFNPTNYPDMGSFMQTLHEANTHLIISVWPLFDVGAYGNYLQLSNAGVLYPPSGGQQVYDAFSATGRQIYWQEISSNLLSVGLDGWWLDASEPQLSLWPGTINTAAGPAVTVANAFPLMHTMAVYQGQRTDAPKKRPFILTRSAYAGQQRNGAVTWSGDIDSTWQVFAAQIPAGLNFSLSGIPYWNTDIGGYLDDNGTPTNAAYAELFTRWFQYGAFCPMFRVHGTVFGKEMWQFPSATQPILINFDKLRYHLLPYIYSVSWMVSSQGYTMMRPLVMDFQQDTNVFGISDQFMFGPVVMANPVLQAGATNRNVYLPEGSKWYDFWTGQVYGGGQTLSATATIDIMPLMVRAGSIIPYGPNIGYATQSADPIELRVYRGADGNFTLYEDENDNYDYETGADATIPFSWSESAQTLSIGPRQGSYPGMLSSRTFNIVLVSPGHGSDVPLTLNPDATIQFDGSAQKIQF